MKSDNNVRQSKSIELTINETVTSDIILRQRSMISLITYTTSKGRVSPVQLVIIIETYFMYIPYANGLLCNYLPTPSSNWLLELSNPDSTI